MSAKKVALLSVIAAVAFFLRFYQLGGIPPALDWDEASLGWNAYSILKTASDEYGKFLPVSLRSFNDYKPPLYAYATVPSVAAFGLNEFSVRLPSAIAGVLTVLLTFFLVRELSKNDAVSCSAAFLLAVSPWSIQFSRVAFETNLAVFFFVAASTVLAYFLTRQRAVFLAASFFLFVLSMYTYHSPRLVVPLFCAGIVIWYRRIFISHWKALLVAGVMTLILLYPLARNTLHVGALTARFDTVSIFSGSTAQHNPSFLPALFAKNYLSHYNFDFLFLNGDGINRHHAPDTGVLLLITAPLLLAGFYFLAKNRPPWAFFVLWWLAVAPVASAVTLSAPHAVRSELFLPTFQIVAAYGLIHLVRKKTMFAALAGLLFIVNVFYFLHQYFVHLPVEYAPAWQYGYKQAVKEVLALEKNYPRIYITSAYDQPYIYFLFYGRISPVVKNDGYFYQGMDKYQFFLNFSDKKGLFVWSPQDTIPSGVKMRRLDVVNFPDGTPAFFIGKIAS